MDQLLAFVDLETYLSGNFFVVLRRTFGQDGGWRFGKYKMPFQQLFFFNLTFKSSTTKPHSEYVSFKDIMLLNNVYIVITS